MKRYTIRIAAVAAMAVAMGACGSSGGSDTGSTASTASTSTSAGGSEPITLKIGFSGALSGIYAAFDTPMLDGMKFAAQEINESGGNVKVELTSEDNKGDTQLTATQTQQLLDDGAKLNVVGVGDGRVAAGRLVSDAGGLALSGLNTYPSWVQEAGDGAAMATAPDNVEGAAVAKYACDKGYRSAYTLTSDDTSYTKLMPLYFADAFAKLCQGKVVGTNTFTLGATDFSPQVTKLKNASPAPDMLFSSIFVPDSNAFVKQAAQAGVKTPLILSDANYLPDFTKAAGAAADGIVLATYAYAPPGSQLAEFTAAFTKQTGKAPLTPQFEAIGRDQIYALAQGAKQAGSDDPAKILEQLSKLPPNTLIALRKGTIDPTTRLPKTAEVSMVKIKGSAYELLTNIVPDYVPTRAK